MVQQNALALSSKYSSLPPSKKDQLVSYLPDTLKQALTDPGFPQQIIPVNLTIEKLTRRVDVSHFKEFLQTLSSCDRQLFISAFPKYKQVQLSDTPTQFGGFKSEGLSNVALTMLFEKALTDFPPPAYLPFHPLIEILGDTGVALSKLVYFLGLFDVAAEVKKIISQKTLKTLQNAFDAQEIFFLNATARREEIKALPPIHLEQYNGNVNQLKDFILERGIVRFARGIHNAPTQYHFFITYFLPKKIGKEVNHWLKNKQSLAIDYNNWESDILETWRFLCTYSQ